MAKSDISVFLKLVGNRQFSKEVLAAGAELEGLGLKGAKAMSVFAAKGEALKKFGRSWTRNVSLPVSLLGAYAVKSAVDFKRQMGLIATDAGGTAREVSGLEGAVLGLARETQYGPTQLAESLFHVESAGYRGARALKVLRESARLATAGNSELEGTTYALVSANKALNEGQSLKGITKTAAQLNEIVSHGDIRLEELTAAMSTGLLPTAKALGLGVEDVGSALDIMTARGIPAQRSAYALNFTLQKLVPSTEAATSAFDALGIGHEELLKIAQHKGLPWALERLKRAMHGMSKGQEVQTIDEMFGGGRMSKGLLVVIQHLREAKEKFHEINGDVALYSKHVKEAEEQPLVKLKKAWSGIQAVLVELGGTALPMVVPGLEKLASAGEAALHAFVGLPGPVQASIAGFLILTGPVMSGLGYFASGLGRILVMTNGVAKFAKTFSAAIAEAGYMSKLTVSSSFAEAWGGSGAAAALETAKGFAYALGPAVAAYGIGNIVTSALSGDWRDAGFEAGGAIAGGIAGFMVTGGNPLGAMLGVGIGSLGGELLSGLFSSGPHLSRMRQEMIHLHDSTESYRRALKRLATGEDRVDVATKRHHRALAAEQEARRALIRTLARYGGESIQAARAQWKLDKAQRAVKKSANAEHKAAHLNKFAARVARQELTQQVASIKDLLPGLKHRAALARKEANEAPHRMGLQKRAASLTEREMTLVQRLPGLYSQARRLGSKPWAQQLEHMTVLQAEFGRKGKAIPHMINEARHSMERFIPTGKGIAAVMGENVAEVEKLTRVYERLNELGTSAPGVGAVVGRAPHPVVPHGPRHHARPKHHRNTAAHTRRNRPALQRLSLSGGGVLRIEITNHNVMELDGKAVAENTTRQSRKAANRE